MDEDKNLPLALRETEITDQDVEAMLRVAIDKNAVVGRYCGQMRRLPTHNGPTGIGDPEALEAYWKPLGFVPQCFRFRDDGFVEPLDFGYMGVIPPDPYGFTAGPDINDHQTMLEDKADE